MLNQIKTKIRSAFDWLTNALNKIFSSAFVSTIVPLLSLGVGFALSSWKDDIFKTFFHFSWPSDPEFNEHASIFWTLLWLLAFIVGGNTWAKNRDSKRTTDEVKGILSGMQAQSDQLKDAVTQLHSLPPRGVLSKCKEAYELCDGYYHYGVTLADDSAAIKTELEKTIRGILFVMESVIRIFDGDGRSTSEARYGFNIMVFVRKAEYDGAALKNLLQKRLQFPRDGASLDTAVGALDILPELSVATDAKDGDSKLAHFAMLIDCEPRIAVDAQSGQPALAGATDCCINIIHTAVPSVDALRQKLELSKESESLKQNVLNYFGKDEIQQTVKSFLCIPLTAPNSGTSIAGVLNIHRNMANPSIEERMALLIPLMTPFRHQLARLLLKYKVLYLTESK